jgi:predicted acyltransferase (DUF342 family)
MKKYELTDEFKVVFGVKLFRIKALIDFSFVRKGDLGGWIQKEDNLSQSGNAWVYGDARVYGKAEVYGNARVYGNAEVYGNARVYVNAEVSGDARVYGNAEVSGDARVYGNAWVYGNAEVYGNAVSTKKVFTLNFMHQLTLTDNHIKYGCEQKTVEDWTKWLDSDEEYQTKRTDEKFKLIEMSLRLAIEQHRQLK